MGSYPDGAMVARDGTTVMTDDTDAFGKEWQVLGSESMNFHKVEGVQHPDECIMPSEMSASTKKRRLGESMITKEDAAFACAHAGEDEKISCVFDVLATNDVGFADSY